MRRHRWEARQRDTAREQKERARAANQRKEPTPEKAEPTAYKIYVGGSTLDRPTINQARASLGLAPIGIPHYYSMGSGLGYAADPIKRPTFDLPTRAQAEPITAWKRARFLIGDAGPILRGVIYGTYTPVATAEHIVDDTNGFWTWISPPLAPNPHEAPHPDCVCGFYGVTHQRLHEVSVDYCGRSCADLEVELYGKVIAHKSGWRASKQRVLAVHLDLGCTTCRRPAVGVGREGVLCAGCGKGEKVLSPADLASAWGVEVRWQERP